MKKNLFKNKKVLVVGMGLSGIAAVEALADAEAKVSCQDSKSIDAMDEAAKKVLEKRCEGLFCGEKPQNMDYDLVVVSPGVPLTLDFVKQAMESGVEVIGELELAYRLGKGSYVAITGTNGKTTTTTLVGEMFKADKRDTHVVGNIGIAVASKALESTTDTWFVTETSSFQLETIKTFRPKVTAILNLAPDHLDRHGTYENYIAAKARIFENQGDGDYAILNYDDEDTRMLAAQVKATVIPFSRLSDDLDIGAFVKNGKIVIRNEDGKLTEFVSADELLILGSHNLENALAATAIAYFAGVGKRVINKTLRTFKGVEHRIEDAGTVKGVKYINDSKGTNPDAAIKAIRAMKEQIVLIAGGYDKGADFSEFVEEFNGKVKHVVLLGATAVKIKDTAEKHGFVATTIVKDMEDCVREASRLAHAGDVVLLSPACASWDMYQNFEERGRHFKECVKMLERE